MLNPAHEESGVVEPEADSRGCCQGLGMEGDRREEGFVKGTTV